jgi:hypothetical protein
LDGKSLREAWTARRTGTRGRESVPGGLIHDSIREALTRLGPIGGGGSVPSNVQDEGDEEPDGAGSTPGSPPPMLNPAST